jgi:hypothetical protein
MAIENVVNQKGSDFIYNAMLQIGGDHGEY